MKRVISILLVLAVLVCTVAFPASAATSTDVEPLYDHINSVYANLSINKLLGIATCTGRINAKKIVPVKVIVRLQQYNEGTWTTVTSWNETGTASVSCTNQYAIYSGYTYRVRVTGYVYDSEGVIQESATVTHTVEF